MSQLSRQDREQRRLLLAQVEEYEQNITLVLQQIDKNVSDSVNVIYNRLLPLISTYGEHSSAIFADAQPWLKFFESLEVRREPMVPMPSTPTDSRISHTYQEPSVHDQSMQQERVVRFTESVVGGQSTVTASRYAESVSSKSSLMEPPSTPKRQLEQSVQTEDATPVRPTLESERLGFVRFSSVRKPKTPGTPAQKYKMAMVSTPALLHHVLALKPNQGKHADAHKLFEEMDVDEEDDDDDDEEEQDSELMFSPKEPAPMTSAIAKEMQHVVNKQSPLDDSSSSSSEGEVDLPSFVTRVRNMFTTDKIPLGMMEDDDDDSMELDTQTQTHPLLPQSTSSKNTSHQPSFVKRVAAVAAHHKTEELDFSTISNMPRIRQIPGAEDREREREKLAAFTQEFTDQFDDILNQATPKASAFYHDSFQTDLNTQRHNDFRTSTPTGFNLGLQKNVDKEGDVSFGVSSVASTITMQRTQPITQTFRKAAVLDWAHVPIAWKFEPAKTQLQQVYDYMAAHGHSPLPLKQVSSEFRDKGMDDGRVLVMLNVLTRLGILKESKNGYDHVWSIMD